MHYYAVQHRKRIRINKNIKKYKIKCHTYPPSIVSYIDTIKGGFFMRKKIMVLLICAVSLVSIPFSVIAAEKNVHTNVAV